MQDLIEWLVENEPAFRKSRLPSLYSDLAVQRTTNPEGYAANVLAWQSALTRAAESGKLPNDQRLILQASGELLDSLASPKYGRPSGLGLVLDDSVRNAKMMELRDFEDAEHSIYQRNWIPSPWTVLRWGLKQAGLAGASSYDQSGSLRSGRLVLITVLEDVYKQITAQQAKAGVTLTDRVMTRDAFTTTFARFNDHQLSPQDVSVLLRYLERDKGMLSYDSKTVKFKASVAESPEPITAEDATIANLKSLIESLETQITNLNVRIANMQKNAKLAVESKNKTAALSALRSKKLAEKALQQRTDTLTQLEEVFSKIEQAVDQVQVMEAMQGSASVLRGLNKKIGGVERVEDVVEELREQMSKVDEVGQVLQEPLDSKMILDETEVDDELEEMEKEEKRKEDERKAEETRKRLAELEADEKRKQTEPAVDTATEVKLKSSIEQLNKMNLTEESTHQSTGSEELERVPEHAS